MANVHYLKTWKPFFQDVKSGMKQFEVRKNDRDYQVGDTLILNEVDQNTEKHTGDWVAKSVVYKLDDTRFVKEGFIILGLQDIKI